MQPYLGNTQQTDRGEIIKAVASIFNTIQSARNINAAGGYYDNLIQQQEEYRKQQLKNILLIGGGAIVVTGIIIAITVSKSS